MIHRVLSWLGRRLKVDDDELQKDLRKLGMGLVAASIGAVLLKTPETVVGFVLSGVAALFGSTVWFVGLTKRDND